ncbi:MAG: hypothetical protein WC496_09775 [Phycisphaerae bacterium]
MSEHTMERRREKRLNYHWPVWFAEDFTDILSQGQMVNISSDGAAFTCFSDSSPYQGQYITARFSVPRHDLDDSFNLENHIRSGFVCRVENISSFMKKIVIQFAQPLPFKPGEQREKQLASEYQAVEV